MDSLPGQDDGALRSTALKAVRRLRGLSAETVASGMNIRLRTYERFEAGQGRLNIDYIHRFCAVTDSDPHGLLAAIAIGSPEFAVRTAGNKMMTILVILLQQLDHEAGDQLGELDARTLIGALTETFDGLAATARRRAEEAGRFLQDGADDLAGRRPRPGR